MQPSLFIPTPFFEFVKKEFVQNVDEQRKALEESLTTKWYCVREILYEQYLWDMRCWHKPKYQYSKAEVSEHIQKWIKDHEAGNHPNNCGHCVYCMRKLLTMKWATVDEIAGYTLKNNNISYANEVGTWLNDEFTESENARQVSDCVA